MDVRIKIQLDVHEKYMRDTLALIRSLNQGIKDDIEDTKLYARAHTLLLQLAGMEEVTNRMQCTLTQLLGDMEE